MLINGELTLHSDNRAEDLDDSSERIIKSTYYRIKTTQVEWYIHFNKVIGMFHMLSVFGANHLTDNLRHVMLLLLLQAFLLYTLLDIV